MLRILFLLILTSCTLGSSKFGGKKPYQYDPQYHYTSQELFKISRATITSYQRDPRQASWEKVFSKKYPIKKVSTFSFESIVQPTRAAIAGFDKVYLSPKGKQLLTEKLLTVWEEAFTTVNTPEMSYLPMLELFDDHKLHSKYGLGVKDYGGTFQEGLASDDIFFKQRGKSLSSLALFQPSFARDLSLLLVPGYQLFGGPRGNEFQKYYLAEIIEKFKLDAAFAVMVEIDWQASRIDKVTKQSIHQKAIIKLKVTPLISYKEFAKRLKDQGINAESDIPNLSWGSYESTIHVPVDLEKINKDSTVEDIDRVLLRPIFKTYTDMCVMMSQRLYQDFKHLKIK